MKVTGKQKIFAQFCKQNGLPEPVPEYKFHPWRKWRIDYYFQHGEERVALEVEGGVWTGGRHTYPTGFLKDIEKYNELSAHGIFLVRTTPSELLTLKTIKILKRCLRI